MKNSFDSNEEANMEFKNVALIGAGAVGAYFIYGFTNRSDLDFCVVAEGDRLARLKKDGIIINDETFRPNVRTPQDAKGADLVLVCTKYTGLMDALPMIETIVDAHTTVISLLNGIDSEEIIASRIGEAHMLYSVMRISSERRGGKIHFVPETTIGVSVGEKDTPDTTPRLQAFLALMEKSNLKATVPPNILVDQWNKYANNIIFNLPQAVLGVGYGAYYSSTNVAAIRDRLFDEIVAVAKAEGISGLRQADWRGAAVPTARFSTLQDLDAGRHTEIDMFTGVLIRLANKHNIAVPFAEYTHYAIKALEEKGDGII